MLINLYLIKVLNTEIREASLKFLSNHKHFIWIFSDYLLSSGRMQDGDPHLRCLQMNYSLLRIVVKLIYQYTRLIASQNL